MVRNDVARSLSGLVEEAINRDDKHAAEKWLFVSDGVARQIVSDLGRMVDLITGREPWLSITFCRRGAIILIHVEVLPE